MKYDQTTDSVHKIIHCVKSVLIWSYSGPHFPIFSLNVGKCRPE